MGYMKTFINQFNSATRKAPRRPRESTKRAYVCQRGKFSLTGIVLASASPFRKSDGQTNNRRSQRDHGNIGALLSSIL